MVALYTTSDRRGGWRRGRCHNGAVTREVEGAGAWGDALAVIAACAEEAERACRLPAASFEALRSTGLLTAKLPRQLGGPGISLGAIFDQLEAIAVVDGSAAWNGSTMSTSAAWPASRLPDEGISELVGEGGVWPAFAGTFVMSGQARPVPGGFRVSGRWGFASGIRHADWVVAGCVRSDGEGNAWCVLPVTDVVIHDTWDTIGLRGTGSCDYTVNDVFVPCSRAFFDLSAAPRRGEKIHRLPILAFLTPDHTAVTLGNARRSLDCLIAQARKQRVGSASPMRDRGAFRRDIGRADARLRAARTLVRDVLDGLDASESVTQSMVEDARAVAAYAAEAAVDVATMAYRYAGAHAVLRSSELGRAYRDTMTSSQHIYVTDEAFEQRAAALLSEPPPG